MSKFVRAASWLRFLFTPAHTAQAGPVEVSDDVSLTAPYDGGGYPLFDPGQWITVTRSATVAAAITTLITVPTDSICRLLAVSTSLIAGVAPDCSVEMATQTDVNLCISELELNVPSGHTNIRTFCPILGPGHVLKGRHIGGDAATIVDWHVCAVIVPLGSNFSI